MATVHYKTCDRCGKKLDPMHDYGECKYWEEESTFCLNKEGCYGSETTADWFCADGERKEKTHG